jgi:predicted glycoside hydrolase/deacetylase ChbG (UPF0249 family)
MIRLARREQLFHPLRGKPLWRANFVIKSLALRVNDMMYFGKRRASLIEACRHIERPRAVVFTGDDFGLAAENNAGIITAYEQGILSTTCLMVGGDAVDEAVDMARRHPALKVGLHVAFADTRPILPPEQVSMLVQPDGRFPPDERALKVAMLSEKGRRQIRAEIAAQFRAYFMTGLECDHVNTHRHIHRNPLLAWKLFSEAARWHVTTTRIPFDPPVDAGRHARATILRRIAAFNGLSAPGRSIGRDWNAQVLVDLLEKLPKGRTELYFHPVNRQHTRYAADLPTLLDRRVRAASDGLTVCLGLRSICNQLLTTTETGG